jgi:dehydrogenase/reductase SDR family protein 12
LRGEIDSIEASGASLVIIGNGSAEFAQAFREDLDLTGPILIDPDLLSYRAAGLRRGRAEILSPRLWTNAARALGAGYRQNSVEGDPWQLGGVFVIRPGGDLLYQYRSREAGDHADPADILASLNNPQPMNDQARPEPPVAQRLAGLALGAAVDPTIVFSFDRTGFLLRSLAFSPADLDVDLQGRHCVITGANSGIGLETATGLADLGARVSLLCRNPERAAAAKKQIEEETGSRQVETIQVDMSDLDSVERASGILTGKPVDMLIHNAGILADRFERTPQDLELAFATHIAGPHLLTRRLEKPLRESNDGRLLWVSSGGMYTTRLDVDRLLAPAAPYDGVMAYAQTKRAQVVLAELWAERLGKTATVHSMHPGWADTPAVRSSLPLFHRIMSPLLRSPAEGADTLLWLAASEAARNSTGNFYLDRIPRRTHILPFTRETDRDRRRLWDACEQILPNGP